jgi:hypothetical protein
MTAAMLALALPVQAAPIALPYTEFGGPESAAGAGGLLFTPSLGFGGWIGVLQASTPGAGLFDTLTSFTAVENAATGGFDISGDFFFIFRDLDGLTPDDDRLEGTLTGTLVSEAGNPAMQLIDVSYLVTAGSGLFSGFTGEGRSMIRYDSAGFEPYSYSGSGMLMLADPAAIPEPGTLALAGLGLLAALGLRRASPGTGTGQREIG